MVGAFTMQGSEKMYKFGIKEISRPLPKINKYFLGFFLEKEWMGDKAEAYYSENLSESGYKGLSGNRAYVYDRRNATKQRIPDAVTTCEMA